MARSKKATIDLKVRMKEPLRAAIAKAAKARGVSLNAEVVSRLEQTWSEDAARTKDFGDDQTLGVMRALATAKTMAEMTTGKDAYSHPKTARVAFDAMTGLLDTLLAARPGGAEDLVDPTKGQLDAEARTLGQNIRDVLLEGLGPVLDEIRKGKR
jgi:hypothetical protein